VPDAPLSGRAKLVQRLRRQRRSPCRVGTERIGRNLAAVGGVGRLGAVVALHRFVTGRTGSQIAGGLPSDVEAGASGTWLVFGKFRDSLSGFVDAARLCFRSAGQCEGQPTIHLARPPFRTGVTPASLAGQGVVRFSKTVNAPGFQARNACGYPWAARSWIW
jgi:hypothetical protein